MSNKFCHCAVTFPAFSTRILLLLSCLVATATIAGNTPPWTTLNNEFKTEFRTLDKLMSGGKDPFYSFADLLPVKPRLYNSSIALTCSFFSYYLPSMQNQASTVSSLVNQNVYGLFGFMALALIFVVPVILTGVMYNHGTLDVRSADGEPWITSPIMKIENVRQIFDEEYRDEIGLDYKKCLQKTICEAHRAPKNKKYGILALPFQWFYPPRHSGKSLTSYEVAAREGKYNDKDCGELYRCFFDTLDLAVFLIDWHRLTNDPDYKPGEYDFQ